MLKKILFPINQNKEPLEVIHKVIELSRKTNIHLIILSIIQKTDYDLNLNIVIKNLLKETKKIAESSNLTYDLIERAGSAEFVICNEAEELNVDVIVIGTRGINLKEDDQSTVSRIIKLSNHPVLIVP